MTVERSQMQPYRLAILNSHPVQYGAPFYRRLAQEPEVDFTVYFCSRQGAAEYLDDGFGRAVKWDVPLLEGYPYKFLPNLRRQDKVGGYTSLINPAIIPEIWRTRPDALLLAGYAYLTDALAFLAARLRAVPILFLSESSLTYDREVRRPFYIRWGKPVFLRTFFRRVHGFLAIGSLNAHFYRHYGVDPGRIFFFPHAVDNQFFERKSAELRPQRNALRAALGIRPNDVVFLFAAKMSAQKAPLLLLEAFRRATQHSPEGKALLMVGDGELRSAAEAYVRQHGLKHVVFPGFANQTELPRYYAISDVFVRPDGIYRGDWGLTVNEAMACGLAVIATDKIGATVDLVRPGENGYVVRFGDVNDLAGAIQESAADQERVRRMGRRSLELIRTWSNEETVQGLLRALRWLREHAAAPSARARTLADERR